MMRKQCCELAMNQYIYNMKHLLLLPLLLIACKPKNQIILEFPDSFGIDAGDRVSLNYLEIGTIEEVALSRRYQVCATVVLDQWIKIPVDSKPEVGFGINITPGKSKRFLHSGDTLQGSFNSKFSLDTIVKMAGDALGRSKPVRTQDSLVSELNELNEKLEKLDKTLKKR